MLNGFSNICDDDIFQPVEEDSTTFQQKEENSISFQQKPTKSEKRLSIAAFFGAS